MKKLLIIILMAVFIFAGCGKKVEKGHIYYIAPTETYEFNGIKWCLESYRDRTDRDIVMCEITIENNSSFYFRPSLGQLKLRMYEPTVFYQPTDYIYSENRMRTIAPLKKELFYVYFDVVYKTTEKQYELVVTLDRYNTLIVEF